MARFSVTRLPGDARVAQQLREATPYGAKPRRLLCDNDSKLGVLTLISTSCSSSARSYGIITAFMALRLATVSMAAVASDRGNRWVTSAAKASGSRRTRLTDWRR